MNQGWKLIELIFIQDIQFIHIILILLDAISWCPRVILCILFKIKCYSNVFINNILNYILNEKNKNTIGIHEPYNY